MPETDLPAVTGTIVPAAVITPADTLSDHARQAVAAGKPPSTRRAYEHDWADFTAWCAQAGRQALPAAPETLVEYATYLCYFRPVRDRGKADTDGPPGLSPSSVQRALSAIRFFHDLAGTPLPAIKAVGEVLKGHRAKLAEARDPRARPRQVTALSPADLQKMTTAGLRDEHPLIQARDTAMIYLMFSAVTRVSELVLINIEDVARDERGLTIAVHRIKNSKYTDARILAADSPKTVAAVTEWIAVLAEHGRTSGPLFPRLDRKGNIGLPIPGKKGPGAEDGRISERGAESRVDLAAGKAGIEGRVTVHSGRRGFATHARLAGHDRLAIGRHGGWADRSPALDRYIDEADAERLNPLRGLGV